MRKISSSVGLHGVNNRDDVRTVQELLNLVPHALGGPMIKLATDGLCGRKTNGAIEKVQATKWGWRSVTTRVEPNSATWKFLMTFDSPAPLTNFPPIKAPEAPKVLGTRFIIQVAAKADQRLDANGDNFYFKIMNQQDQSQQALYFLGRIEVPPPNPTNWTITKPAIVTTPQPLGVADWVGTAIFYEKQVNGVMRTEIWVNPEVLRDKLIRFEIYPHLNEPSATANNSSTSFSSPFQLREVSQGVKI
jgi:hypothetical protein